MTDHEQKFDSVIYRITAHDHLDQKGGGTIGGTSSLSNFTITTPTGSNFMFSRVQAIQVVSAFIPNTFYNVPVGSVFTFADTSGAYNYTLPTGQYDITTLFATIAAYMESVGDIATAVATVSSGIDPITQCAYLEVSDPSVIWSIQPDREDKNYAGWLLGTSETDTSILTSTAGRINFTHPPRLQGPRQVVIHCPQIAIHHSPCIGRGAPSERHVLSIPLTTPWGSVQHYMAGDTMAHLFDYAMEVQSPSRFEFSLRNERGELLDTNGHDWGITLKMYYQP